MKTFTNIIIENIESLDKTDKSTERDELIKIANTFKPHQLLKKNLSLDLEQYSYICIACYIVKRAFILFIKNFKTKYDDPKTLDDEKQSDAYVIFSILDIFLSIIYLKYITAQYESKDFNKYECTTDEDLEKHVQFILSLDTYKPRLATTKNIYRTLDNAVILLDQAYNIIKKITKVDSYTQAAIKYITDNLEIILNYLW